MISSLFVQPDAPLATVFKTMDRATQLKLARGIVLVVDKKDGLLGTITDGDIRRGIARAGHLQLKAEDIMHAKPITFDSSFSATQIIEALPGRLNNSVQHQRKFLSKILLVDTNNMPVRIMEYHELWEQRVATHRHIVVVGLGYVGLTLALALVDEGFYLSGYDVDQEKIRLLQKGQSYIHEIGLPTLLKEHVDKNFIPVTELPADGDVYIISVGTPVARADGQLLPTPQLHYLEAATRQIGTKLERGNLVILRSTVPIGTCREFVIPVLEEESGLQCGLDFHVSFAPERTAEGKAIKELRELPQIIGGYNKDAVEATVAIFRELTSTIVRVESLEAAEMIKLINNSFRDYVFAFANELSIIASKFNINVVEAIKSANKGYPRNPVPLPSPGVGGPCLTKDPYIFAAVAQQKAMHGQLFINSRSTNESMHEFVVSRLEQQLLAIGKSLLQAKILICGLAFKGRPETGDIRNSSSVEIYKLLEQKGADCSGYDPVAPVEDLLTFNIKPKKFLTDGLTGFDAILFLNNHKSFERLNIFKLLREMSDRPILFDGWSQFHPDDILNTRPSVYMNLSVTLSSIQS